MKNYIIKHKKVIIPLLVLGIVLVSLFIYAKDDLINFARAEKEPPTTEVPEVEEEPEEEPEPEVEKEPEEEIEPQPEEEPEEEPEAEEKPNPEPEEKPEPEEPKDDTPIIYIGQQLKIPGTSSPASSGPSKVIREGTLSSSSKQIALTFDAGWIYEPTLDLLDTLDKYNVKSTFFLRGLWAKDHPNLVREIAKRGHRVENHSLTHGHMREMSDSKVRDEIIQTTNIIKEITGYRPYLFRPPYGEYDNRILKILGEQGYTHTIMWTIDSHDWAEELNGKKITKDYLVNQVLNNASNNGIVLMHIGGHHTVEALPEIITGLRNVGYKLVKVNDMLPKPSSGSSGEVIYTVEKGDTLYSISRRFGVTVEDIIELNNLK